MRPSGFSLLEVMVAVAVMALGLSGLAALLLASSFETSAAEQRTVAAVLAEGLAARIRLAPDAAGAHLQTPPASAPDCGPAHACTPALFAAQTLFQWQAELLRHLPRAGAAICRDATPDDGTQEAPACDGAGPMVIKIFWRQRPPPGGSGQRLWLQVVRA